MVSAWATWKSTSSNDPKGFNLVKKGNTKPTVDAKSITLASLTPNKEPNSSQTLASLKQSNTSVYNLIKSKLGDQRITLPPSPAIAGVYASVDRDAVFGKPRQCKFKCGDRAFGKISDTDQDRLNIDSTAGKSINAIRSFTGKGTLVWGGRTLAGNDNEWRYISVRRLFINIEESTRKGLSFRRVRTERRYHLAKSQGDDRKLSVRLVAARGARRL